MDDFVAALLNPTTWSQVKTGWDLTQNIVVIGATLFTANWTYKTFGHKEKVGALKSLLSTLRSHQDSINMYSEYMNLKSTEIKQGSSNPEFFANLESLMSKEFIEFYRSHFKITEILDYDLDLNESFKTDFRNEMKKLPNSPINNLTRADRNKIYLNLRKKIEKCSVV